MKGSLELALGDRQNCNLPIPITVPYSGCDSSALTVEGHSETSARRAKKATERVEKRCRDWARVGRRATDMAVVVVVYKESVEIL